MLRDFWKIPQCVGYTYIGHTYDFDLICMIFGRTDLRKGASRAKFDGQADFEVHLAVAPQKPSQNSEKLIYRSKNFVDFVFFDIEK